jgi:hypothetical protein
VVAAASGALPTRRNRRGLAGQLGLSPVDEGVQGVGGRAGGVGEHVVDLVRGELRAGVGLQVSQDVVAQPTGQGGRSLPAADRGFQRPPRLGGLVVDLVQALWYVRNSATGLDLR